MTSLKTQKEIRERLVILIASHTSVPAESVGWNSPIWVHFPASSTRKEHPTVTSFVDDVQSEFNVYLTEEEWEEPTPDSLAQVIRAKSENPAASVADWTNERAARKKGMISAFVIIVIVFPAIFVFGSGPWVTRVVVGLGLPLFLGVMLLVGYRKDARKLDASAPRK
jgi:hypothetical protein